MRSDGAGQQLERHGGIPDRSVDYVTPGRVPPGPASRHETKLTRQYEQETQALADFENFRTYFEGFLRAIPWPVRKWLKSRIVSAPATHKASQLAGGRGGTQSGSHARARVTIAW